MKIDTAKIVSSSGVCWLLHHTLRLYIALCTIWDCLTSLHKDNISITSRESPLRFRSMYRMFNLYRCLVPSCTVLIHYIQSAYDIHIYYIMSSRFLSRDSWQGRNVDIESEWSNCFSINLPVFPKFIEILFTDTSKTQWSGRHFDNNFTQLGYSLSATEAIVNCVANQRTAFAIEHK